MKHGSLFSGIGGFDLASEWMGWENVFHCEWMPFPRQVLHHYWPNSISYEDITKTDFTIYRGRIDILTGGFPCQPYSQAGKRLGKEDERHLWPEMLRAIREIAPRWVVGENVRGLTNWNGGLVFEEVCADLEAEGYEVQPFLLPACAVNAPHRRDRIWFVATNPNSRRLERTEKSGWDSINVIGESEFRNASNTNNQGLEGRTSKRIQGNKRRGVKFQNLQFARISNDGYSTNTYRTPLQCRNSQTEEKREEQSRRIESFGEYSSWEIFPTQPPICGGNDGLPIELDGITFSKWRAESIKGYGNAVVPQLVLQIFKAIELYELKTPLNSDDAAQAEQA